MLSFRTETVLKSIVGQYIAKARPVPSQSLTKNYDLRVSPATIRNEMAYLEHEGYIIRAHPSAGSIPSDKGYRHYVETLEDIRLSFAEECLVSHLFHQVERELDEWLNLATSLIARMVQNLVVVTIPKSPACQFKRLELISLQDFVAILILILSGARVRQQLITFNQVTSQAELTNIANKLSNTYAGLTGSQIQAKGTELSTGEQQITECLVRLMEAEDERGYDEYYLNGLHFLLNQPEFTHHQQTLTLLESIEQRNLLRHILPPKLTGDRVQVIIGKENKMEAVQDYSIVLTQYGVSKDAYGIIIVIGPTRMPYAQTIASTSYLSAVLSKLISQLYGRDNELS